MSRDYIDEPTISEMLTDEAISGLTIIKNSKEPTFMSKDPKDIDLNIAITQEKVQRHKDRIEKQTGVFHWLHQDENTKTKRYIPVNALSEEQLNHAMNHSEELQVHLQKQIDKKKEALHKLREEYRRKGQKIIDNIEAKVNQICAWQYRLDKLEEERDRRKADRPSIVGDSEEQTDEVAADSVEPVPQEHAEANRKKQESLQSEGL